MPSGYTYAIYNGDTTDPKEFILTAARGLGFLIHMRDDSHDTPIRKREVPDENSHSVKTLNEYRHKYQWYMTASDAELLIDQEREIAEAKDFAWEAEKKYTAIRERYVSVMDKLKQWSPTTEAGQRVKEYGLEQLVESIKFDCDHNPWDFVPERITAGKYREKKVAFYTRMVMSYDEVVERERESAEATNRWIDELMQDLELL